MIRADKQKLAQHNRVLCLDGLKIKWLPYTDEFKVYFIGDRNDNGAYFTNDLDDAIKTAQLMKKEHSK